MWNKFRQQYQPLITEIQKSIDDQLYRYSMTGDENHKLFAEHQIKHLTEIKDHIVKLEKDHGIY